MFKKKAALAVAVAALLMAGCGGGSSDSSGGGTSGSGSSGSGSSGSGSSGGGSTSAVVAGPLDTVQTAVKSDVLSPLITATAGTPVSGVLQCADAAVNENTLDIIDSLLNSLSNPATIASTAPAQAQAAVSALVSNLSGLLTSLASSSSSCTGSATVPTSNPLSGTPLAALGDALLPALTEASQELSGSASGSSPLSAADLSTIIAQLSSAYSTGLAALPSDATTAPIVGGTLVTVGDALSGLKTVTATVSSGDTTGLSTALQTLVTTLVGDLTTKVVPINLLQTSAGSGASTDVLAQIQAAVASLTSTLGTNPTTLLGGTSDPLSTISGFAPLTDIVNQLIGTLSASSLTSALPTGTSLSALSPLDAALGPVESLLNSLLAPVSGSGSGGSGSTCLLSFLGLC